MTVKQHQLFEEIASQQGIAKKKTQDIVQSLKEKDLTVKPSKIKLSSNKQNSQIRNLQSDISPISLSQQTQHLGCFQYDADQICLSCTYFSTLNENDGKCHCNFPPPITYTDDETVISFTIEGVYYDLQGTESKDFFTFKINEKVENPEELLNQLNALPTSLNTLMSEDYVELQNQTVKHSWFDSYFVLNATKEVIQAFREDQFSIVFNLTQFTADCLNFNQTELVVSLNELITIIGFNDTEDPIDGCLYRSYDDNTCLFCNVFTLFDQENDTCQCKMDQRFTHSYNSTTDTQIYYFSFKNMKFNESQSKNCSDYIEIQIQNETDDATIQAIWQEFLSLTCSVNTVVRNYYAFVDVGNYSVQLPMKDVQTDLTINQLDEINRLQKDGVVTLFLNSSNVQQNCSVTEDFSYQLFPKLAEPDYFKTECGQELNATIYDYRDPDYGFQIIDLTLDFKSFRVNYLDNAFYDLQLLYSCYDLLTLHPSFYSNAKEYDYDNQSLGYQYCYLIPYKEIQYNYEAQRNETLYGIKVNMSLDSNLAQNLREKIYHLKLNTSGVLKDLCSDRTSYDISISYQKDEKVCTSGCMNCTESSCSQCSPFTTFDQENNTCNCQFVHEFYEDKSIEDQIDWILRLRNARIILDKSYIKEEGGKVTASCSQLLETQIVDNEIDQGYLTYLENKQCEITAYNDINFLDLNEYDGPYRLNVFITFVKLQSLDSNFIELIKNSKIVVILKKDKFQYDCTDAGQEYKITNFDNEDNENACISKDSTGNCNQCKDGSNLIQSTEGELYCGCAHDHSGYGLINVEQPYLNSLNLTLINIQIKNNVSDNLWMSTQCLELFTLEGDDNDAKFEFNYMICWFKTLTTNEFKTFEDGTIVNYKSLQSQVRFWGPSQSFLLALKSGAIKVTLSDQLDFDCQKENFSYYANFEINILQPNCTTGCLSCEQNTDTINTCSLCNPLTSQRSHDKPWECLCFYNNTWSEFRTIDKELQIYELEIKARGLDTLSELTFGTIDCNNVFAFYLYSEDEEQQASIMNDIFSNSTCIIEKGTFNQEVPDCEDCSNYDLTVSQLTVKLVNISEQVAQTYEDGTLQIYLNQSFYQSTSCIFSSYLIDYNQANDSTDGNDTALNFTTCDEGSKCLLCSSENETQKCEICPPFSTYNYESAQCDCQQTFSVKIRETDYQGSDISYKQIDIVAYGLYLKELEIYRYKYDFCDTIVSLQFHENNTLSENDTQSLETEFFNFYCYFGVQQFNYNLPLSSNESFNLNYNETSIIIFGPSQNFLDQFYLGNIFFEILPENFRCQGYQQYQIKYKNDSLTEEACDIDGCLLCQEGGETCGQCIPQTQFDEVNGLCGCIFNHSAFIGNQTFDFPENQDPNQIYYATFVFENLKIDHSSNHTPCSEIFDLQPFLYLNDTNDLNCFNDEKEYFEQALDLEGKTIRSYRVTRSIITMFNITNELISAFFYDIEGHTLNLRTDRVYQECSNPLDTYIITNYTFDTPDESDSSCEYGCLSCSSNNTGCDICMNQNNRRQYYEEKMECACRFDYQFEAIRDYPYNDEYGNILFMNIAVLRLNNFYNIKYDYAQDQKLNCSEMLLLEMLVDDQAATEQITQEFNSISCQVYNSEQIDYYWDFNLLETITYYYNSSEVILLNVSTESIAMFENQIFQLRLNMEAYEQNCSQIDRINYAIRASQNDTNQSSPGCVQFDSVTEQCNVCTSFTTLSFDGKCLCNFNYSLSELYLSEDNITNVAYLYLFNLKITEDYSNLTVPCTDIALFELKNQSIDYDPEAVARLQCQIYNSSYIDYLSNEEMIFLVEAFYIQITISNITNEFLEYAQTGALDIYLDNLLFYQDNCQGSEYLDYKIDLNGQNETTHGCDEGCIDCVTYEDGHSECQTCNPHTFTYDNQTCYCYFEYQQYLIPLESVELQYLLGIEIKNMHLNHELANYSDTVTYLNCSQIFDFYDYSVYDQENSTILYQIKDSQCVVYQYLYTESLFINSQQTYGTFDSPTVFVYINMTEEAKWAYENYILEISLNSSAFKSFCLMDEYYFYPYLYPNYNSNNTNGSECALGCVSCTNTWSCDMCRPDTLYNEASGQCDCVFSHNETVVQESYFGDELFNVLSLTFNNIRVYPELVSEVYNLIDCSSILDAQFSDTATEVEQYLIGEQFIYVQCYAFQYEYLASIYDNEASDDNETEILANPIQARKNAAHRSIMKNLRSQKKQKKNEPKQRSRKQLLGNDTIIDDQTDNGTVQSGLYNASELYIILTNMTDDLLQAYRDKKYILSLLPESFYQECDQSSVPNYIIEPQAPSPCELGCVSCGLDGEYCEVCKPYTNISYDGYCDCKNNYNITFQDQPMSNLQMMFIEATNIRIKQQYIEYGPLVDCGLIFTLENFRNISSSQLKFLMHDLNQTICQVFNGKTTEDVAIINEGQDLSSDYYSEDFRIATPQMTIVISNVSNTIIEALRSQLFDLYLNLETFSEQCFRKEEFDFVTYQYRQVPFQIMLPSSASQEIKCPAGCFSCPDSKSCDQCGPYTESQARGKKLTCNPSIHTKTEYYGDYIDSTVQERFAVLKFTVYNVEILSKSLTERFMSCDQLMSLQMNRSISALGKEIIDSGFSYTTCRVTALQQYTYFYNEQSYESEWIQVPVLEIYLFDMPTQMLEGFRRSYFQLILDPSIFVLNAASQIQIPLTQDYFDDRNCAPGCTQCVDIYSCQKCAEITTLKNPITMQCECVTKVQMQAFFDQEQGSGVLNIDLFDLDYNYYAIFFDYLGYGTSLYDLFSITDIVSSMRSMDYQDQSQFFSDLDEAEVAFFLEWDIFDKRVQISQSQSTIVRKTYLKLQIYGVSEFIIQTLNDKRVTLYLNPDNVFPSNYDCVVSANAIPILAENTVFLNSNQNGACSKGCSYCDQFGYCLICNQDTFSAYFYEPKFNKQCLSECPISYRPDYDLRSCLKCDADCGVCSSTYECFACNKGILQQGSNLTETLYSGLSCLSDQTCPYYTGLDAKANECMPCEEGCSSCTNNYKVCAECDPYYLKTSSGSCTTECSKAGQFINIDKCEKCDSECSSCQYASDYCMSCKDGFILEPMTQYCVKQDFFTCPDGYYFQAGTNTCEACSEGCISCQDSSICYACESSYILQTNETATYCSTFCPDGFYAKYDLDNEQFFCEKCSDGCLNCWSYYEAYTYTRENQISQKQGQTNKKFTSQSVTQVQREFRQSEFEYDQEICFECADGLVLSDGFCFEECPAGTYTETYEIDIGNFSYCSPCPVYCTKCKSYDTCDECYEYFSLIVSKQGEEQTYDLQKNLNQACADHLTCPNGTYYDGIANQCVACAPGCALCDSEGICIEKCKYPCNDCLGTPENCLTCQDNFFIASINQHPIVYSNISSVSSDTSSVIPPYNGYFFNQTCVQDCAYINQVLDPETNKCVECPSGCQECELHGRCLTCLPGLVMSEFNWGENETYSFCMEGCAYPSEKPDPEGVCRRCSKGCLDCLDHETCAQCSKYTVFEEIESKCLCKFNFEIYPRIQKNEIVFDTLNLAWNELATLQGQTFDCAQIMNFTSNSQSDLQSASFLKCQVQEQYGSSYPIPILLSDSSASSSQISPPYYPWMNEELRTRFVISNFTNDLMMRFFSKQLRIFLNEFKFTQDCVPGPKALNYELKLFDGDYQNYTAPPTPASLVQTLELKSSVGNSSLRCQNFSVSVKSFSGFNENRIRSISWSVSLRLKNPAALKYTNNKVALEQMIYQVETNHTNNQTIFINSNLTEMLIADVQMRVMAQAIDPRGFVVVSNYLIDILGSRDFISFAADKGVQRFYAMDGVQVDTSVLHPWCPNERGIKFTLPPELTVYCAIYNRTDMRVLFKNNTDCSLKPSEGIESSNNYSVRLYVNSSVNQGIVTGNVILQSLPSSTQCVLNNNEIVYTFANDKLTLSGKLSSTQEDYYFEWYCLNQGTGKQCTEFNPIQTVEPQLVIDENTLGLSKTYQFTMRVVTRSLSEISSCSVTIYTYSYQKTCNPIKLQLESNNNNSMNYIDPTLLNNFMCSPQDSSITQNSSLSYSWSFSDNTTLQDYVKDSTAGISVYKNTLQIKEGALEKDRSYLINCQVKDSSSNNYCGNLTAFYTTRQQVTFNISFNVTPLDGYAFDTKFNLTARKLDSSSRTKCGFGYVTQEEVELESYENKAFTSNNETFVTFLPSPGNATTLTLYAKCIDANMLPLVLTQSVNVKPNGTFNKNAEIHFTQQIEKSEPLTPSQAIMMSQFLKSNQNQLTQSTVVAGYKKLSESLSVVSSSILSAQDLNAVADTLNQITENLVNGSQLSGDSEVIAHLTTALNNILQGQTTLNNDGTKTLQTMNEQTFNKVVKSANDIMSIQNQTENTDEQKAMIDSIILASTRVVGQEQPNQPQLSTSGSSYSLATQKVSTDSSDLQLTITPLQRNSQQRRLSETESVIIKLQSGNVQTSSNSLIFTAVLSDWQLEQAPSDFFASDVLTLSAEESLTPIALSNTFETKSISNYDLETPVTFNIPLSDTSEDDDQQRKMCIYLDQTSRKWKQSDCQGKRLSTDMMQCCSYQLTSYAVKTMPVSQGVQFSRSFIIPTIVIIDLVFIIAAVAGHFFDKKGLIYIQVDEEEFLETKNQDGGLKKSKLNKHNQEQVSSIELNKSPSKKLKRGEQEAKVVPAEIIDVNEKDSKKQMTNNGGNFKDQAYHTPKRNKMSEESKERGDQSPINQSASQLMKLDDSHLELTPDKNDTLKLKQKSEDQTNYTVATQANFFKDDAFNNLQGTQTRIEKNSLLQQYILTQQMYHRLISSFFKKENQMPRPLKALANFGQIFVMLLISGLLTTHLNDVSIGYHILICFASMRPLQIVFNLLINSTVESKRRILMYVVATILFASAFAAGHVIAFIYGIQQMSATDGSELSMRADLNQWGVLFGAMLIIELGIWDFIIMPLIVILLGKINQRIFNQVIFKHEVVTKVIEAKK